MALAACDGIETPHHAERARSLAGVEARSHIDTLAHADGVLPREFMALRNVPDHRRTQMRPSGLNAAGADRHQSEQRAHQCGLASTVRADEADQAAGRNSEADIVQNRTARQ